MIKALVLPLLAFFLLFFSHPVLSQNKAYNIYHDSDYSNHNSSAISMQMGLLTALKLSEESLPDIKFNFIEKDHRGNSNRSLLHMKQFLKDPHALFMLGGLHSPPYIRHRDFINQSEILLLVPWAAGGPITRYAKGPNWVFRLSVDDTKAGKRIVEFAQDKMSCKSPYLLLENTPWGKSNEKTMQSTLGQFRQAPVVWFNWNTRLNTAKITLRDTITQGADCILFVGNSIEGRHFVDAMASFPKEKRIPIISHWGITGGNFFSQVKAHLVDGLRLNFIQSCFSFVNQETDPYVKQVLRTARGLFPEYFAKLSFINAPAGFIHGFDLGMIFVQALKQTKTDADIDVLRARLRQELEDIKKPIKGLIKNYTKPFAPWTAQNDDAHEALGLEDFCMAKYETNGAINVLKNN